MSQGDFLCRLRTVIEHGKARGYDEMVELEGGPCYRQFALKLKPEGYLAYVFTVQQARMDVMEDYDVAEETTCTSLADAVEFLQARGADFARFKAFKANCPI